jgi:ketosteroid isomerase-like protein
MDDDPKEVQNVSVLSPESAWVLGHWALQREKERPGGVFTLVLRKFAEGWKIVHDHTSAVK